ncbi:MAG: DUF2851 family protein [Chloroflexi bacterium]|nr:DUF2851 family protein [Chloroflexota bacterium]
MDPASGSVPGTRLDERLVARLWDDQHPFFFPLKTSSGEEVRVVYRGRRRYDRGPDFPNALIVLPGEVLVHGDVEVHVNSSDWRRHGHHRDPHYNGVVLHVVLRHDDSEPCIRQDGSRVPVVALEPHLSRSLEQLLIQDASDAPRPSPCWRASLENGGELGRILDGCGMERFEARVRSYEAALTCYLPDQLLYQGIAIALGYSRNQEPFEKLADVLPLRSALAYRDATMGRGERERGGVGGEGTRGHGTAETRGWPDVTGLEALMLGAAGLLPSQRGVPCEEDGYSGVVEDLWAVDGAAWAGTSMHPAEWQFFRVRPNNFPTRRLAALAHLASAWPPAGLSATLVDLALAVEPRKLPRVLERLLEVPRGGYWAGHCDFGLELRCPADLIGRQRAAEVAINVFLPFLAAYAVVHPNSELRMRACEAYRLYPKRGDNELTRYVALQVTGIPRPPVGRSACRQQGLLHIYRTWCEMKRCGECAVSSSPTRPPS